MAEEEASMGGVSLRPRDTAKRAPSGEIDDSRFSCPFPNCKRTFAELWRLKVHCRASPDVRGSGRERGHGQELAFCPKCKEALQPGKHHIGCAAGRSAPRQAAKRLKTMKAQVGGESRGSGSGGMGRMSSASSSGTFWTPDGMGSPGRDAQRKQARYNGKGGFSVPAEAGYRDFQSSLQFQSAYAQAWNQLRPGMERHASDPLPRFQPFGLAPQEHGMGHYDPTLLQAAQAAMPRMESRGSTDLDLLQQQPGGVGRPSAAGFAARSFSLPQPGSIIGGGTGGGGPPGLQQYNSGTYGSSNAAAAALTLQGGLPPAGGAANDPLAALAQQQQLQVSAAAAGAQPWGLPFPAHRGSSAFDAAAAALGAGGYDSRVLSPQPRYPGDLPSSFGSAGAGTGAADNLLWGSVKAAAAAAASRPQAFNQNAAAIRFLEGQRALMGQPAGGADFADLYTSAAELINRASAAGPDAARLAEAWGGAADAAAAQPPLQQLGDVIAGLGGGSGLGGGNNNNGNSNVPKWDPLPQREPSRNGSGGLASGLGGAGTGASSGGAAKDAAGSPDGSASGAEDNHSPGGGGGGGGGSAGALLGGDFKLAAELVNGGGGDGGFGHGGPQPGANGLVAAAGSVYADGNFSV